MKTQQELMQAYWGPGGTVDMVKEYNAKHSCDMKPWRCIRLVGTGSLFCDHPSFAAELGAHTFALTILYDDKRKEHRPVFVGDRLWLKHIGIWHEVTRGCDIVSYDYSWNPPTSKRTFKIGDMELPCPGKYYNGALLGLFGIDYFFKTVEDRNKVTSAITDILTAARDKD